MVIDNKYEIYFSMNITKKVVYVKVHMGDLLYHDLRRGIQDQITANLNGYVDDNIPLDLIPYGNGILNDKCLATV